MKNWKSMDPYNHFQSGSVQKVVRLKTDDNIFILSAKVLHSQRLNVEPLSPWVAAKIDGTIICAHCNCMAG